jgi:hypothetical protein
MAEYISLRAYARRRGVALSAVQKAIESRRVHGPAIRESGERITGIDPELADQQWARNTDPVEAARNGKLVDAPAPLQLSAPGGETPRAPAADRGGNDAPAAGDQGDYLAARAKREGFLAKQAELDYLEQVGLLVPSADVEREFSEIFGQLKSSVMRIPDSAAQALAAETDPARINRLLSDSLRKTLDEFSRRLTDAAAGGAAEREVALP